MAGYNSDENALTLGDDDSLKVGDYEVEYNATNDEFQARYGRPIGGEAGAHGEVKGAEYVPSSQVGDNSISLSGGSEVITVPHQSKLNLNNVTISAWINVDRELADMSRAYPNIIEKGGGGPTGSYTLGALDNGNNEFGFRISTGSNTVQALYASSLTPNVWVHVVGTYDGSTIRVYEDGAEQTSTATTVSINQNKSNINIGKVIEADIDDVRIYDRALSASEVTDLFNGVDVTNGLIARYDFEYPETPDVAIDSTGDVYPKNSIPRATSGSLVPQGLAESVSAGEALADDGNTYETVQAAVDAASGWVFVGPGTFNEAVTISTAGLTLEGCGEDTLIDGGTTGSAITISETNVTVQNLSVQTTADGGNEFDGVFSNSANTTVENVTVIDSDQHGVQLITAPNSIVNNCTINSTDGAGVNTSSNETIISNCHISSTNSNSIVLSQDDSIVSNNIIQDSGSNGIGFVSVNDTIIKSNRVINSSADGMLVNSDSNDNIIANNRISDSTNADIQDNGTGTVLDDNLTGASN